MTLAFYGTVGAAAVPRLGERLGRAASRQPPMRLRVAGAGAFPRRLDRARVLWVGLDGDLPALRRLAERARAAGRGCGIEMAGDAFRPHLTLARARPAAGADAGALVRRLERHRGEPFTVEEVVLVRSHLGAAVEHEPVARFRLGGLS